MTFFSSKSKHMHSRKRMWKCRLQNVDHFSQVLIASQLIHHCNISLVLLKNWCFLRHWTWTGPSEPELHFLPSSSTNWSGSFKGTSTSWVENARIWQVVYSFQKPGYTATLIARFMGPTWGPSRADRTQVGPMLAPLTLLSGDFSHMVDRLCHVVI